MKKPNKNDKARSPDQCAITVSMPVALKKKLDYAAKLDSRARSNWIVKELERAVEQYGIKFAQAPDCTDNRHC